jgi:hypothetical protein
MSTIRGTWRRARGLPAKWAKGGTRVVSGLLSREVDGTTYRFPKELAEQAQTLSKATLAAELARRTEYSKSRLASTAFSKDDLAAIAAALNHVDAQTQPEAHVVEDAPVG